MRRFGFGLLVAIVGYVLGAVAGYWLTDLLSSNVHDRSVEAAMTSAFVWGPLGALAGFALGFVRAARRSSGAGG
jgi:cation transporter-like permease